ncbi:MAG: inorganic phosphate transporter [Deltaproteobacteria bacterium]|nr:inorganic phosphate transporter [Deltaproteobacteria bacterium]
MSFYLFSVILLIALAVCDLIVGVINDAVNFLNSSIGSMAAPRHIIMIVASLGILAGVTFSSGMMEVARKGIFHPRLFIMPELITMFLAVMLTDIILLDLFNTYGLPTSTTVSIVFELLGAAVAVSLIKIFHSSDSVLSLVHYINTAKAFAIISGILLSVVIAFGTGAVTQFVVRLFFTFDYKTRLKRFGGVWAGLSLAAITYFILIKGAKGTSFLTAESIAWIKANTWLLMAGAFCFFGLLFQCLATYTKTDILKPIVLIGTFALAMAFAGNDLVNFVGVPLAGLHAYRVASATANPLQVAMQALEQPIQTNTVLLLIAGAIMTITLWVSHKSRTVLRTELSLGRQEEGFERFGSSVLSRNIVRLTHTAFSGARRLVPVPIRKTVARRLDPGSFSCPVSADGDVPSFDLLRASVNLFVASVLVSFATSLKLPLSTTYVTFMVSMGTSLADQAWGRESAVYRVAGVLTVIGGWFLTALVAFAVSLAFAVLIYYVKLVGIVALLALLGALVSHSYRLHRQREQDRSVIEAFGFKDITEPAAAVNASFEQTGCFLKEVSDSLGLCFEAVFLEDRQRLRDATTWTDKIQKWANTIIANVFETLFLLRNEPMGAHQKYARTIRVVQGIAESHRDMIQRAYLHFENCHQGFSEAQKEELRRIKVYTSRPLWNASIMLRQRKEVDYDYIANQVRKLKDLVATHDAQQIERIRTGESGTRVTILYYALTENAVNIAEQTRELLEIFKESFEAIRA